MEKLLRSRFPVLAAGVLVTLIGCSTPALQYDLKMGAPGQFQKTVRKVVVSPLRGPVVSCPKKGVLSQKFETVIIESLEEAGMEVVPTHVWSKCWQEQVEMAGGLYDPKTGRLMKNRKHTVWTNCAVQMRESHDVDAVVSPDLKAFRVSFEGKYATWHGVTQKAITGMLSDTQVSGHLSALSLLIQIRDTTGAVLFENGGGIELLGSYDSRYLENNMDFVDNKKTMYDHSKVKNAVDVLFAPLLEKADTEAPARENP